MGSQRYGAGSNVDAQDALDRTYAAEDARHEQERFEEVPQPTRHEIDDLKRRLAESQEARAGLLAIVDRGFAGEPTGLLAAARKCRDAILASDDEAVSEEWNVKAREALTAIEPFLGKP